MIYFTSDLHAFHKDILLYDSLPFETLEEYRKCIIKTWNSKITDKDEVYILGDVCVGGSNHEINYFLSSLNGIKYLILGNHDREFRKKTAFNHHFEWIKDYHYFDYDKIRYVLMHFPIESWLNKSQKSIHLHGHSHGNLNHVNESVPLRRMDVGFKACNLNIYSIEEIYEKISKQCQK